MTFTFKRDFYPYDSHLGFNLVGLIMASMDSYQWFFFLHNLFFQNGIKTIYHSCQLIVLILNLREKIVVVIVYCLRFRRRRRSCRKILKKNEIDNSTFCNDRVLIELIIKSCPLNNAGRRKRCLEPFMRGNHYLQLD